MSKYSVTINKVESYVSTVEAEDEYSANQAALEILWDKGENYKYFDGSYDEIEETREVY